MLKEANLAFDKGELKFQEVGKKWGLDRVGVSFGSASEIWTTTATWTSLSIIWRTWPASRNNGSTASHSRAGLSA